MSGPGTPVRSALSGLLRLAFRAVPLTQPRKDRLRQVVLEKFGEWLPAAPKGQWVESTHKRRPLQRADGRSIGYVAPAEAAVPVPRPAILVAFYLPQFHAIAENDQWWGKGFTEWRNVTRALPQFEGHAQPRLPGELGFYDLSNPLAMHAQARLAREHGVAAFCAYFYWFDGKVLLETPLRHWLDDPALDIGLCLCWANESWARRWDGRDQDILLQQQHSPDDDLAFISHVAAYLRDPRYLRVNGKPVLLVYRPGLLPEPAATAGRWRAWCHSNGVGDIHLVYVQSFERPLPADIGFDAAVQFPPNLHSSTSITRQQQLINPDFSGNVADWRKLPGDFLSRLQGDYPLYPAVNCGWDNEARRSGKGLVYHHASPRGYGAWLRQAIASVQSHPASHRLVFINAWNEWAEGAVLEPDASLGHAYLSQTRSALSASAGRAPAVAATGRQTVVVHAWYLDVFDEIVASLVETTIAWYVVVTTQIDLAGRIEDCLARAGLPGEVIVGDNRGRDVLPFLKVANRLLDEGVDVVLKLHTKRSDHRQNGAQWRRELVQRLLGADRAPAIMAAFADQPGLGIVAPEGHLLSLEGHVGANATAMGYLATCIGLPSESTHAATFVAGSMFWARLSALQPLLDARLLESDFEPEQAQIDGTLAHAVERSFTRVAAEGGYVTSCADEPRRQVIGGQSGSYPYTR